MITPFLTAQLESCGPLDFVRVWVRAAQADDDYRVVVEVVREEPGDGLTMLVPGASDRAVREVLERLGVDGDTHRFPDGAGVESQAAGLVGSFLDALLPPGTRVSVTHGQRAEMERRRRVEAVAREANRILGEMAAPGAWSHDGSIPMHFQSGTVQLTVWPKDSPPDAVLDVWALVAKSVPERPEVAELIARCNEGFTYGRLVRQGNVLWYRETIHAMPLAAAAFQHSLQIAINTAHRYGPEFAQLGAVDATAPDPSPAGLPARPPDAAVNRLAGYL